MRRVEEEPAQAGAALTGGAHRAEEDRAQGEVEVGVGLDDDGVVAAEFEDAAAEALGAGLGDVPAHLGRAGEGDQRDARVVDHPLADRPSPGR